MLPAPQGEREVMTKAPAAEPAFDPTIYTAMFDCDTARISRPMDRYFLIVGRKRNTHDDPSYWVREDGKRIDFDYTEEHVVISGLSLEQLHRSACEFKRRGGDPFRKFYLPAPARKEKP